MGDSQSRYTTDTPSKNYNSRPQEKAIISEITEEKPISQGGSHFISVEVITKVSASVCKVNDNGTGFLGKFLCNNEICHGLFTNNHVLTEEMLADSDNHVNLNFESVKSGVRLSLKNSFRFTCPLLDVTFIRFEEDVVKAVHELKCEFLTVHFNWTGKKGDQLLIIQNPGSCSGLQVASGAFYRMHGFDILHKASTDYGSSGSPLFTCDGKVIGIHKRRSAKETDHYNIAVSAKAVLGAIYNFKTLPKRLISNPRALSKQYEDQIFQQKLIRATSTEPSRYAIMYVSSATRFIVTLITPIWFIPTSHGWYWTPTDPFGKEDVNWMSVHNLKVIGGYWHNIEPADKNIVIIKWLRINNIVE